jgi:NADPH:quinone reductase-like Zn-dependent oxidoreductase
VQLAKAFGAEVAGMCSTAKEDMARSLGADRVIDYTCDDFADRKQHWDVVLDIGGNASLSRLRRTLTTRGTLVIVGGEMDGRWFGGTIARSGRSCCPRSWARSWGRSSPRRISRT